MGKGPGTTKTKRGLVGFEGRTVSPPITALEQPDQVSLRVLAPEPTKNSKRTRRCWTSNSRMSRPSSTSARASGRRPARIGRVLVGVEDDELRVPPSDPPTAAHGRPSPPRRSVDPRFCTLEAHGRSPARSRTYVPAAWRSDRRSHADERRSTGNDPATLLPLRPPEDLTRGRTRAGNSGGPRFPSGIIAFGESRPTRSQSIYLCAQR